MEFSRSSIVASRLVSLVEATSTNDELAARVRQGSASDWPEFSVVLTDAQTSGRGRLGRAWVAPRGTMLAVSVLVRPTRAGIAGPEALGWIPLLAGLAMTRALESHGVGPELKWPNDVLIGGRKVCGILVEAVADDAVVIGSGINLTLRADDLPVPTATSMAIEGGETDADVVLSAYLTELRALYTAFAASGGDARASGLHDGVTEVCSTLGRSVRVELPGGAQLVGVAESLDATGRLVVRADERRTAVAAGDVTHLRY